MLWSIHFGLIALAGDLGWPVELWAGITCTAALVGFGLALLVVPPASPVAPVAGTRDLSRERAPAPAR